jgi:hypoxanthine-guanine phosphoribosyltransferase
MGDVAEVLITSEQITEKVREMGERITGTTRGRGCSLSESCAGRSW